VRDLLQVLYLPAEQYASSLNVHILGVSVSHFNLLEWVTPTFILSGLWLYHPDLNPVNYKICAEIQQSQQRVYLKNVHDVHGLR